MINRIYKYTFEVNINIMKKLIFFIVILGLSVPSSWAQVPATDHIPLIGSIAPSFTAESTNGPITFPEDYGHKWKILFSHPKDFTPVCSSELIELADMQPEFDKLNAKIVVLSTDELSQHKSWKESMQTVNYKGRQTPEIKFPLVADPDKTISMEYGMLHSPTSTTKDVRGVFIIDPNDVVQAVFFYPMGVGRNMNEILRTVEALQAQRAQQNIAIPANWEPGDDVLLTYLNDKEKAEMDQPGSNIYQVVWYMVLEKAGQH